MKHVERKPDSSRRLPAWLRSKRNHEERMSKKKPYDCMLSSVSSSTTSWESPYCSKYETCQPTVRSCLSLFTRSSVHSWCRCRARPFMTHGTTVDIWFPWMSRRQSFHDGSGLALIAALSVRSWTTAIDRRYINRFPRCTGDDFWPRVERCFFLQTWGEQRWHDTMQRFVLFFRLVMKVRGAALPMTRQTHESNADNNRFKADSIRMLEVTCWDSCWSSWIRQLFL